MLVVILIGIIALIACACYSYEGDLLVGKVDSFAIFSASTRHVRFAPKTHKFKYNLFYFAIKLDTQIETIVHPSFFAINSPAFSLFSLKNTDYLSNENKSIKQKLLLLINRNSSKNLAEKIGNVILITTPKLFGYSFNPLSIYYCYQKDSDDLCCVVLEVHNTFTERHFYLLEESSRLKTTRPGFDQSHKVFRTFHVSPFNNRSGVYEIHFSDLIKNGLQISLSIKDYHDANCEKPEVGKRFFANLNTNKTFALTNRSILATLIQFPINVFLTSPRIMYQAFIIAFKEKLPVFQRPDPISMVSKASGTIAKKSMTKFQGAALDCFRDSVLEICKDQNICLRFSQPDPLLDPIMINPDSQYFIDLKLSNYKLFVQLLKVENNLDLETSLLETFSKGDWVVTSPKNLTKFLNLVTQIAFPLKKINESEKYYGLLFSNFEKWLFSLTTTFVIDPNLINERVLVYKNEFEKVKGLKVAEYDNNDGDGNQDLVLVDDGLTGGDFIIDWERKRAFLFLNIINRISNSK